jgi:hypothetical protein
MRKCFPPYTVEKHVCTSQDRTVTARGGRTQNVAIELPQQPLSTAAKQLLAVKEVRA